MKLKILIITVFFPPSKHIASQRPYSWAKYWSESGNHIDVLTLPSGTNEKENKKEFSENVSIHSISPSAFFSVIKKCYYKFFKKKNPNNGKEGKKSILKLLFRPFLYLVKFLFNFFSKKGVGLSTRMPDPFDLWIKPAKRWVLQSNKKWDVVISTFGPYAPHSIAHFIKSNNLCKIWVADYRDFWTDDTFIFKGVFPFIFLEKYLEKKWISKSDLITTISSEYSTVFKKKFPEKHHLVIENGFIKGEGSHYNIPFFPDNKKIRIIYTGSLYFDLRDPSPLFLALQMIRDDPLTQNLLEPLEVLFFGPNVDILQPIIEKYNISKWVKLMGAVDRLDSLKIQKEASALIFLDIINPKIDGVLSGKIYEYMNSNVPIWVIGNSTITAPGRLVENTQTGCVYGNNCLKIKQGIIDLIEGNSPKYTPNHKNIAKYYRKNLAFKLLDEIKSFL